MAALIDAFAKSGWSAPARASGIDIHALTIFFHGKLEGVRGEERGRLEAELNVLPLETRALAREAALEEVFQQATIVPPFFHVRKVLHDIARAVYFHTLVHV